MESVLGYVIVFGLGFVLGAATIIMGSVFALSANLSRREEIHGGRHKMPPQHEPH